MKQLLFDLRTSRPYKFCRMLFYYLFEYQKRNARVRARETGADTTCAYLRKYRDIHKGQRCFIVATGPSLTAEDLELIRNEYTIGVNALCMKFKEMNWKTSYFVISDSAAYTRLSPVLKECRMPFFSAYRAEAGDDGCIYVPTDIHNSYMVNYDKKEFRKNIELGIGNGNTVVIHAIQIAAYMGFEEIYLLGVDCNYDLTQKKLYFVDHGIRGAEQKSAGEKMIADFASLKRYEDQWGIRIYNAARGGMLEVFPRVKLEDVIKADALHE